MNSNQSHSESDSNDIEYDYTHGNTHPDELIEKLGHGSCHVVENCKSQYIKSLGKSLI